MYNLGREVYKKFGIEYSTPLYDYINKMVELGLYDKKILEHYTEAEINEISEYVIPTYDLSYTISATKSLIKKYLIKQEGHVIELPQFANIVTIMFLDMYEEKSKRLEHIKEDYNAIASLKISLATPFKANLRKPNGNLSSCFVLEMDDNTENIVKSISDIAQISRNGGGVGIYLGRLRPSNALVRGNKGANNINVWAKLIDSLAPSFNQCGIRNSAFTISVDVFHKDIMSFLELKTESGGDVRQKAFNIFPQVIINTKFIEAVKNNDVYPLLDSHAIKNKLNVDICNPKEFNENYSKILNLVKQGKLYNCELTEAKKIWKRILEVYVETGELYIVHKDNMNFMNPFYKDNKFIQSGNLCLSGDTILKIKDKKGEEYDIFLQELKHLQEYEVLSYNLETKEKEFKKGYDFIESNHSEYYEIEDEKGNIIKCSSEHKIFTQNRGYVKAKDLLQDDILLY